MTKEAVDATEREIRDNDEAHSLQGKVEILVMENERVEALNRGLTQNLSELEDENRYHKKTVQTLKETNEDIYSKFQILQSDLHQQKVIRDSGEM